jgi:hypothetical protein
MPGSRSEQRHGSRVVRAKLPPEYDDRDPARTGQLQRDSGRLGAAARHPSVVDQQDISTAYGHSGARPDGEPCRVQVTAAVGLSGPGREGNPRQLQARGHQAGQRVFLGPAAARRHYRPHGRAGLHSGRTPDAVPMVAEEAEQRGPQARPCGAGAFCVVLVPPQVRGQRAAADGVGHYRDDVG